MEEGHNYYPTSYSKFVISSVTSLWKSWSMRSDDWIEVQFSYLHFKPCYVINVVLCAVLWTVARKLVAKKILQVGSCFKLDFKKDEEISKNY